MRGVLTSVCPFILGCTAGARASARASEKRGVGEEEERRAPVKEGTGAG